MYLFSQVWAPECRMICRLTDVTYDVTSYDVWSGVDVEIWGLKNMSGFSFKNGVSDYNTLHSGEKCDNVAIATERV